MRFDRRRGKVKFIAQISINGRTKFLGSFDDELTAARRYDEEAHKIGRDQPGLNFPCPSA